MIVCERNPPARTEPCAPRAFWASTLALRPSLWVYGVSIVHGEDCKAERDARHVNEHALALVVAANCDRQKTAHSARDRARQHADDDVAVPERTIIKRDLACGMGISGDAGKGDGRASPRGSCCL